MNAARRAPAGMLHGARLGARLGALLGALMGALLGSVAASAAEGHPWHRTVAEIDLRAAPPRLEVALRVDALELEQELSARAGRRLDLDDGAAVAPEATDLLRQSFLVRTRSGGYAGLRWVGLETEGAEAWLYFELTLPEGPGPLLLSNQLFLDRNRLQENELFVREDDFAARLCCDPGQPWVAVHGLSLPQGRARERGWSVGRPPTPGTAAARGALAGPPPRLGPVGWPAHSP
jgi:hypothetical protein